MTVGSFERPHTASCVKADGLPPCPPDAAKAFKGREIEGVAPATQPAAGGVVHMQVDRRIKPLAGGQLQSKKRT